MKKLNSVEIKERLSRLNDWSLKGETIQKEWLFKDFKEAMSFINKVAVLANRHDHHPEIYNVYNKVVLTFSTHDAAGLTTRDFKIASEIDRLEL